MRLWSWKSGAGKPGASTWSGRCAKPVISLRSTGCCPALRLGTAWRCLGRVPTALSWPRTTTVGRGLPKSSWTATPGGWRGHAKSWRTSIEQSVCLRDPELIATIPPRWHPDHRLRIAVHPADCPEGTGGSCLLRNPSSLTNGGLDPEMEPQRDHPVRRAKFGLRRERTDG